MQLLKIDDKKGVVKVYNIDTAFIVLAILIIFGIGYFIGSSLVSDKVSAQPKETLKWNYEQGITKELKNENNMVRNRDNK